MRIKLFEKVVDMEGLINVSVELIDLIREEAETYSKIRQDMIREELSTQGIDPRFISQEIRRLNRRDLYSSFLDLLHSDKEMQENLGIKFIYRNNEFTLIPADTHVLFKTVYVEANQNKEFVRQPR
jgi:hypothetical protein